MNELFREAEAAGIHVEYCRLPLNASISTPDAGGDFILMDYSLIEAGSAERVHFAHELGHCMTGSFYNRYTAFDVRQKHENRANRWAIQRLVPRDALSEAVAQGHTELWDLAEHFGVTEDFMRKAVCWYTHGSLATESCGL